MKLTFKKTESGTYFTHAYAVLTGDKMPIKYAIADTIERMGYTLTSISFDLSEDCDTYSYRFTHLEADEDGDFSESCETLVFSAHDLESLKAGDIVQARIW